MTTLEGLNNIPDEEIIEVLKYKPNFLHIMCNIITIEEYFLKNKNEIHRIS